MPQLGILAIHISALRNGGTRKSVPVNHFFLPQWETNLGKVQTVAKSSRKGHIRA